MKKVNLRDLYPDVYKNDYLVEVPKIDFLHYVPPFRFTGD